VTRVVRAVQTGVRMEKRMLKVLKALAELKDMISATLIEGIVLHAFEARSSHSLRRRLRRSSSSKPCTA